MDYWYHNPEDFEAFRTLVGRTWPGMELSRPEVVDGTDGPYVSMFCREGRIDRELYWIGSGFQIWCQLLTHSLRSGSDSLLIVDEPEIYLHPDMQRQLLSVFRAAGPDLILATHSSELISEAEPGDILLVGKTYKSAHRLKDMDGLQGALEYLGSGHNVTLAQLARTRRVLFLEGDDFKLLRRIAERIGLKELASGLDIVPIAMGGFGQWKKLEALGWGMHRTLGQPMLLGAVFDHDYYCLDDIVDICAKLKTQLAFVSVHERKEIENYLLLPDVLDRCVSKTLKERARRIGKTAPAPRSTATILSEITESMKSEVQSNYVGKAIDYHRQQRSPKDTSTITQEILKEFDPKWALLGTRLHIVPGKAVLAKLNERLQHDCGITLTTTAIVSEITSDDVPPDLVALLKEIDEFRKTAPPDRAGESNNDEAV